MTGGEGPSWTYTYHYKRVWNGRESYEGEYEYHDHNKINTRSGKIYKTGSATHICLHEKLPKREWIILFKMDISDSF